MTHPMEWIIRGYLHDLDALAVKSPGLDMVVIQKMREANTARVARMEEWAGFHTHPELAGVPVWFAAGLAIYLHDWQKITSATHLCTLCGMEPRPYYTEGEIKILLKMADDVLSMSTEPDIAPAWVIRAIGNIIERHPGPFGQKDRPWKSVLAWATKESYIPFLREICLRFGATIPKDLSSPYRKVYCETMEQPAVAALPKEIREERARAAAVRAFLSALYYQLPSAPF